MIIFGVFRGYSSVVGFSCINCVFFYFTYYFSTSFVKEVLVSRQWKVWKKDEDFKLRCSHERTEPQVSSYVFWNRVYEDFFEFYPHRSRTAVQQRGHLLGLLSKRVPSEKYICIGCSRVGVHNRKRGLCLRCYGTFQQVDFRGCQEGPGEVKS